MDCSWKFGLNYACDGGEDPVQWLYSALPLVGTHFASSCTLLSSAQMNERFARVVLQETMIVP